MADCLRVWAWELASQQLCLALDDAWNLLPYLVLLFVGFCGETPIIPSSTHQ
jgi:hypothetical protein